MKAQRYEGGGRLLLGDNTDSGAVMLWRSDSIWISAETLCIYTWKWPYLYSVSTYTKSDLCRSSREVTAGYIWSVCLHYHIQVVMKFPFLTERDLSLPRSQETTSSPGASARFLTIPVPVRLLLVASRPNRKIWGHPWLPIQHIYSCKSSPSPHMWIFFPSPATQTWTRCSNIRPVLIREFVDIRKLQNN